MRWTTAPPLLLQVGLFSQEAQRYCWTRNFHWPWKLCNAAVKEGLASTQALEEQAIKQARVNTHQGGHTNLTCCRLFNTAVSHCNKTVRTAQGYLLSCLQAVCTAYIKLLGQHHGKVAPSARASDPTLWRTVEIQRPPPTPALWSPTRRTLAFHPGPKLPMSCLSCGNTAPTRARGSSVVVLPDASASAAQLPDTVPWSCAPNRS